jgi:hypothetical protein
MQVYCSKQHANDQSNRFCIHCGEPLPLATGKVVENRYHILRQLGQGGFGRTYLAEDKNQANENCVLKEFAPQVEAQQDLLKAKELFEREASVLKKLQHPQIPRFHASLQAKLGNKDFFFLVQDYVEGENYYQLLERQTFSEEEVIKLLQEILPVLSYIHSVDVVHRDISPDNLILRSSDKLPVLIDFGGVKQLPASKGFWFTQLGGNRTLLGKKGYAPEEQLRQGKAFPSSDLYSLAVTSLVLFTGKEPQHLYDSYQGVWRWGKEIKVSSQLEAVLKRMLAYKPSDRYQTANEVLKDLKFSIAVKAANPHITKLKTMIAAPGRQRAGAVVSNLHKRTQLVAGALPLPVWLRPFAVSLIGTTAVVLVFAGTWAVVNAVARTVSSISVPSISLPKLPGGGNPDNKPANNKDINQIVNRRQELEIPEGFFTRTVDNLFYAEKPELQGRTLTSSSEDAALRKEWYGIADDLLDKLEQAKLSNASRRKLGNYGSQDYDVWRRKTQAGQLGDYTISQLNKDTNQKFDRLFPGQRRGKLNQKTYGQIWYAIAADQVGKLQQ